MYNYEIYIHLVCTLFVTTTMISFASQGAADPPPHPPKKKIANRSFE